MLQHHKRRVTMEGEQGAINFVRSVVIISRSVLKINVVVKNKYVSKIKSMMFV